MRKIRNIFFPVLLISLHCFPQENRQIERTLTYQYFGVREGMREMQTFYVFQDSFGYLWIPNFNGVNRFDGRNFEFFPDNDLKLHGKDVYIDQFKNDVYMLSRRGITFVKPDKSLEYILLPDGYTNRLERGMKVRTEWGRQGSSVYATGLATSHNSLNPGNACIFRFNLEEKSFQPVAHGLKCPAIQIAGEKIYILDGCFDCSGETNWRMQIYVLEKDSLRPLESVPLENGAHYRFFKTSKNDLFLQKRPENSNVREVYHCSFRNDSIAFRLMMKLPYSLHYIENIGNERYIFGNNASDANYVYENGTVRRLPLNTLICNHALIDKDGSLWLATEEGLYNCYRMLIESCQLGLAKNDNIWSVLKDRQGNLWFSTYGFGHWMADPSGFLHKSSDRHPFGYMSGCIDRSGHVWLTYAGGVICYRGGYKSKRIIPLAGSSLSVFYDALTDRVLAGSREKNDTVTLNIIDGNYRVTTIPVERQGDIISICRDAKQRLRIGFFRGNYLMDGSENTIAADTAKRPYSGIVSMATDGAGRLWKASLDGVFVENSDGTDTPVYDQPSLFILCYQDKYILWGGTGAKLHIQDLSLYGENKQPNIRTFDRSDGFDAIECGQNGGFIDHEGYVWLVVGDKVLKFNPEQLMDIPRPEASPPRLINVWSASGNGGWQYSADAESIRLENSANNLKFEILQAEVNRPDKLQFRIRLNGYDDRWVATSLREHSFLKLSSGTYRFEVRSSIDGERWSESSFSPFVHIAEPWWLTLPFLLLFSLLAAALLYVIFLLMRKILLQKERKARQIVQLKYHSIQSKFIPHFTGNVLNSINYLIYSDPNSARKYVAEFGVFLNRTLLNSDHLSRTLKEELDYVDNYLNLEKLRYEDNLEYSFEIHPGVDTGIQIPTMILQTLSENAIKHGLKRENCLGIIRIEARRKEGFAVISVEDNGIGRVAAAVNLRNSTGKGLKIVEEQLEMYRKAYNKACFLDVIDLYDASGKACGTRFEMNVGT